MYEARVIARQGKTYIAEDINKLQHKCHARSQAIDAVCGDRVQCSSQNQSFDAIEQILPRNNQITRIDNFNREKTLAANIDHMFIVIAAKPEFSTLLIDKYLACAQLNACKASLIINKAELLREHDINIQSLEDIYSKVTEHIFICSAKLGFGISKIRQALDNEMSILVGQSGVGKSSIINRLLYNTNIKVGSLSEGIQQGRHTTTTAFAHSINSNGKIIDSPGVRSFTPMFSVKDKIINGFREFAAIKEPCKFNNCTHINEPGCAIKNAVDQNRINPSRYASYVSIYSEMMTSLSK